MAKKNTSKAKHQPNNAKKTAPTAKTTATEQDLPVIEPANETVTVNDEPTINSVEDITEEHSTSETADVIGEQETDVPVINPNGPTEDYIELAAEEQQEAAVEPLTEPLEATEETTRTIETSIQLSKSRKTKLGTDQTKKLAGCSYHFFRKYFKKRYAEEGIKVRFVKEAAGYNGHMEVAETDIERARGIILKIKAENTEVKNLFWFV
jgi:hypothetical protein